MKQDIFLRFTPAVWTLPGIFQQIERILKKPTGLSQLNALYYPKQWVQTTVTEYQILSFFTSVVQTPKSKSEWLMVDEERCAEQVRPRLCFSNTLCVTPHCLLSHPIPVHFHCLKFYRLLLVTPLSCTPVRAWERLASYHFSVCVLFRRRIKQNNRCLDILIFLIYIFFRFIITIPFSVVRLSLCSNVSLFCLD